MKVKQLLFFILITSFIVSCSTKKNTFTSRAFHAVTTKYNVLFNGKEALKTGITSLTENHQDDFWEFLPLEPIQFEENKLNSVLGGGLKNNSSDDDDEEPTEPFEKAEYKAVKAVQMHSMNIRGVERNKQIDDAYLLLGKARYYSQRFIPAIEAFNHIISNYPYSSLADETRVWRAKSNIRIENEKFASESLQLLLKSKKLSDEMSEKVHTALAMAYFKMDSLHLVKEHLFKATRTDKDKKQRARNLFVLGQLYEKEQKKDSAAMVFKQLKNYKKAPRKFRVHAEIAYARNAYSDSTSILLLRNFRKLANNVDNRPYLGEIYYQAGLIELERDSSRRAKMFFEKSIRSKNVTAKVRSYSYEAIAELHFNKLDYVTASAYYDSVLVASPNQNTLRYRKTERRVKNLESLIKFEETLQQNDSVLRIVAMSKDDRNNFFTKHIAKLKEQDKIEAQRRLNQSSFGVASTSGLQRQKNNKGKWYFYNLQTLSFGKSEFTKIWGNRALKDNWRWSSDIQSNNTSLDSLSIVSNNKKYEIDTYINLLPKTKKEIDSVKIARNEALFELGLIYKEQFTNKPKSISYLERLLTLHPDEKYILPANYHLYTMHSETGSVKAKPYKNLILNKYSNSPFAKVILSPNQKIETDKAVDKISELYTIAYNLFKADQFDESIKFIEMSLQDVENSVLIPKFKLLKAYAIGKSQSKDLYKIALEEVAVSYPNTEEGKQALAILNQLKK